MSSGFVTEAEVAEARQKRQEEWEKVRQPDQPLERPEEPYDSRSLFERLKEQRDKKDLEFEESHKLKNLIRGLDDDEIGFLDIVEKAKMDAEKRQQMQEDNELYDFRQRVATLQEQSIEQKLSRESAKPKPANTQKSTRPTQKSILAGVVVRKRVATDSANGESDKSPAKVAKVDEKSNSTSETDGPSANGQTSTKVNLSAHDKGAMKCIGILPGIGKYKDSSDSEKSTDTDEEYDFTDFDWVGRKVKKDDGCHDE